MKVQLETKFGGPDHGVNACILLVEDLRERELRQFDIFTKTKCIVSSRKKPEIYLERLEVYENGAFNPLVEIEFSEIYSWSAGEQLTTSDAPYIVWSVPIRLSQTPTRYGARAAAYFQEAYYVWWVSVLTG